MIATWVRPCGAESWENLGPDAQREALRNFQHYQRAPEGTRKRLDTQWQRFQELDPAEKDRLRRNLERWRQLPPDTKQELNDRYRSLRQGSR